MKTQNELFQQQIAFLDKEIDIMHSSTGTAAQSTGFDQRLYEDTLSRNDLIIRISALENKFAKIEQFFNLSTITINSLNNSNWKLVNPINVTIEQRSPEDFVACLYDIDLYGYGESIPEALEDFKEALINQFEFLKDQEGQTELGELPNNQLKFLDSLVAKADA